MPSVSKKRRMIVLDKNGKRQKEEPVEPDEDHIPHKKAKNDTLEQRRAQSSQHTKSSFEEDLGRLTQEVNELKTGMLDNLLRIGLF